MMRYENSFRNISAFVISLHLLCIGFCIWTGTVPPLKKNHEKLVVKTVSLKNNQTANTSPPAIEPEPIAMAEQPPAMEPEPEPESEPESEPAPEPEPIPEPKPKPKPKAKPEPKPTPKPAPKPVSKPKPEPKKETKPVTKAPQKKAPKEEKKPVVKKSPPADTKPKVSKEDLKKQELISKAQALFSNTGTQSSKKRANDSSLISLGTIGKLEIDSSAVMTDKEKRYQDILASHLKDRLRFPEYGEVKIKLTLASSGKVLKVEVISSKSDENRSYAIKTLPDILFPSFDTFLKEEKHTFSIALKND